MKTLPQWLINYRSNNLFADIIAGLVVGILVIPQSLGYAVLAGLPPVYGLYASIVPVFVYAWVGSNNVQAVGSVAITAIMTASILHPYASQGVEVYVGMATLLAVIVGAMLWLAGKLRLGWLMQFISRGVASGFVSSASVLIFFSQIKYLTATKISGNSVVELTSSLYKNLPSAHSLTSMLGISAFVLLLINRYGKLWQRLFNQTIGKWLERLFPLFLVIIFIIASSILDWQGQGVPVIGQIPTGLPSFTLPYFPSISEVLHLLPSASLMALIAFVSSSSVGGFYARQRREKFDLNAELKGLGLANMVGGFFQSFTVAGGFSRTAINADSGAETPLASIITACIMLLALLFLGSVLAPLPYALLGATIMASIIKLIDIDTFRLACKVDYFDAVSMVVTFITGLIFGLNVGLVTGLLVSFAGLIWKSSKPHIAIVGVLTGTEHFRNINRHDVQTFSKLLIIRIDESLFFGNSVGVQNHIEKAMAEYPNAKEIILIMSAVNHIDLTAQEMLITLNEEISKQNKRLHYAELKGFLVDKIHQSKMITELSGQVFLSTIKAVEKLK
ncbi:MAG: SulP family inorganic anion transporter [Moraxellaceae bacterium]|nr:SulP family inorganic anion transporter [Moraxellaceae bacterium]